MKPPPGGLAVPLLVSALLLSSCDAFFSTNLFQKAGLGQQKTPSASTLASMSVSDLKSLAESPSFYSDLSSDSAKKTAVLDNLSGVFTPPASGGAATVQEAAALYAQVELNTTAAAEIVSDVLPAAMSSDYSTLNASNIVAFIKASLPADVLADSSGAKFEAAINAILAARLAYDALSSSISSGANTLSTAEIGDAAQGAILAYAVDGITMTGGVGDKAKDLWTLVNGGPGVSIQSFSPNVAIANVILNAAGSPFTFS